MREWVLDRLVVTSHWMFRRHSHSRRTRYLIEWSASTLLWFVPEGMRLENRHFVKGFASFVCQRLIATPLAWHARSECDPVEHDWGKDVKRHVEACTPYPLGKKPSIVTCFTIYCRRRVGSGNSWKRFRVCFIRLTAKRSFLLFHFVLVFFCWYSTKQWQSN